MKKGIILSLFLLCMFSALALAEDTDMLQMQGVVMFLDAKKNTLVINERTFVWNHETTFHNSAGASITADKLKTKGWVYIEGENDIAHKRRIAKKIYLLPKLIERKELHLYPFIKQ
ncbi:MAG: hypothetical protein ACE144_04605 [Thermodesulfobacteriota bacterium]